MADEEGGCYDETQSQLNSESLDHDEKNNSSVVNEGTHGDDSEKSPTADSREEQEGKPRSSSDRSTKESKGNKKSPNPNVQHSYASLTVQERQARAEKLRQKKIIDLKKKENERRTAFEERRKKILAEESAKREALLKKLSTSSPKQTRVASRGSFGSSSPRLISASTSNLSHMRKSHPIGKNIDSSSPSERSQSTSGKDDLPKRPSSALYRPRSSLYLPRQNPKTGQKSQTLDNRPASRSSSVRSTGRPQSAFGSSTTRSVVERPRVASSASTTRLALKKNITPATTSPKKEPTKSTKPLPKPKMPTTPQRPLTAPGDKTRSKTPSKPKSKAKPTTPKETNSDKTTSVEKKKVIRKPPASTTQTTTSTTTITTTTEIVKEPPTVENKKVIKKPTEEITKQVEETPEIVEVTQDEKDRIEEAEQRDREAALERQRKEEEEKQQIEAEQKRREEELERKAKEELQRRAAEREHNKKLEEEARLERKKRVEMIMAKVAGKKDSPEAPPSTNIASAETPTQDDTGTGESNSAKQHIDEILKRVNKPKEQDSDSNNSDSTEKVFEEENPAITISLEEEPSKTEGAMDKESKNSEDEEAPKQISDNWVTSNVDANTILTTTTTTTTIMSESEPILDLSSELKLNDSKNDQIDELQNQQHKPNSANDSGFNLSEFDPIHTSVKTETTEDTNLIENGNHLGGDLDEIKSNGDMFKVDDQKDVEKQLWNEAEQKMISSNPDQDLQFTVDKNSEEGKLWQVAEGQLELSECF